jgi:hypothetical protein
MRLWSLHPKYLDTKGLVALWREALLAKTVLEKNTKGYQNHPQLQRFKEQPNPINAIHFYLAIIHIEATSRNYRFDKLKVNWECNSCFILVKQGQILYEIDHLKKKLESRDPVKYDEITKIDLFDLHPIFIAREGGIEDWEIVA